MGDWILKNLFSILNLIALVSLALWGKVWLDKKNAKHEKDIEELKASHSKELFVHKLQFEKEFKTYDFLWMNVAHFERAILAFYNNPDEPKNQGHLDEFAGKMREVKETIINNTPFISEKVYNEARNLIDLALDPLFEYRKTSAVDLERLRKITSEISESCKKIEKYIRERISNMGGARLIE